MSTDPITYFYMMSKLRTTYLCNWYQHVICWHKLSAYIQLPLRTLPLIDSDLPKGQMLGVVEVDLYYHHGATTIVTTMILLLFLLMTRH